MERTGEIAVIGAGVAGLTTAVTLLEQGRRVVIYARDIDAPPSSIVAPAMFTPYPPPPGPAAERFEQWTRFSHKKLCELAQDHPESGVSVGVLREFCYGPCRLEGSGVWMEDLLMVRRIENRPGSPFREITDSERPHIDMLRYLPWLRSRVRVLGGTIVARSVGSLDELTTRHVAVVNCSGLGAARLAGDPLVKPMHGQVLHVPNDIGLGYSLHDDSAGPEGKVAYIFRFADRLVLGGTFDSDDTQSSPERGTDDVSLEEVLRRCRGLLKHDGHPRWNELGRTVIQARAAQRPTRGGPGLFEDVRVCVERLGGAVIAHNYGHGRMGATVSWGTAADVAQSLET